MPRPTKCRRLQFEPGVIPFKPSGILLTELEGDRSWVIEVLAGVMDMVKHGRKDERGVKL